MVLLVVEDLGTAGGEQLRLRGLAAAIARLDELVVFDVAALRRAAGCEQQCDGCAAVGLGRYGSPRPDPYARFYCREVAGLVARRAVELAPRPVVVSHLKMHQYFTAALDAGASAIALDLHNVEGDLYQDMLAHPFAVHSAGFSRDELCAIREIESFVTSHASVVTVVSARDESLVRDRYAPRATCPVPNAVELGPWPESNPAVMSLRLASIADVAPSRRSGPHLFYSGALEYLPNAHAVMRLATEIYPLARRVLPATTLLVAGRNPPRMLAELVRGSDVRLLANPASIHDLLPGRVLMVPLHIGGGSRLKILEAFAAGCPVISTAKGVEGLEVEPGVHYLPAGTPKEFVRQLVRLVADPRADALRRREARALVADRYSWRAVEDRMKTVLAMLTT